MKVLLKISDIIEKITKLIIAVLLIEMTIVYFAQVVARFVFNSGLSWSEEMVRYSCIAMVFFAAASLFKANDHVAITVIEELLPRKAKLVQFLILTLINIVYMVIVFVFGIGILEPAAYQSSPNMQIPMNIIYLLFPISMAISLFHTIVNLLNRETYKKYENDTAVKEVSA